MDGGATITPERPAAAPVSVTHVMDLTASTEKDPDELLLEQARAEADLEAGKEPAPENLDDVEATQPLQPGAPQEPETTQTPQDPMGRNKAPVKPKPGPVPYERFAEVNDRARTLEQQLAYERGAYEARLALLSQPQQGQPQQPQQQQQPAATPDDRIKAERTKAREAAARWEQGEITASEYEETRGQVEDSIWQIRQETQRPAQQPTELPQSLADEQILAQHAQQLEAAHPYLEVMTQQDVDRLVDIAYAQAAAEGRPIGTGSRETARLREIVSDLSDHYGPKWHPQAEPKQPTAQTQPAAGQLSPQARARLAARARAAQHPVDASRVGTPGAATGEVTAASVARMSEEELMSLPAAVRARFL